MIFAIWRAKVDSKVAADCRGIHTKNELLGINSPMSNLNVFIVNIKHTVVSLNYTLGFFTGTHPALLGTT